jgi:hypothetical protein
MLDYNSAADIHETTDSDGTKLISCDFIQYCDYDNSCAVERANVRYLQEQKLMAYEDTGGYGSVKAWLLDTEENRELLGVLFDYPCFDDELVSQVEMEIEDEYIKDCASDLHKLLSEDMQEAMQELYLFDDIDRDCYEKAKDASNTHFEVECGGNGYIDFKRLVKDYALALCDKYPAIKSLCAIYEIANNAPAFPLDFYESASDMQEHRRATRDEYTQDEIRAIMVYAVELESLVDQLRRA